MHEYWQWLVSTENYYLCKEADSFQSHGEIGSTYVLKTFKLLVSLKALKDE